MKLRILGCAGIKFLSNLQRTRTCGLRAQMKYMEGGEGGGGSGYWPPCIPPVFGVRRGFLQLQQAVTSCLQAQSSDPVSPLFLSAVASA